MSAHVWTDDGDRRRCLRCGVDLMTAHPVECLGAEAAAWRLVVVESPYAGAAMLSPGAPAHHVAARVELHREYLADCLRDCLRRGEAPFASHGLYTAIASDGDFAAPTHDGRPREGGGYLVLDDDVPDDRAAGIAAGLAWGDHAAARVVYVDLGVSRGMLLGIARGRSLGQPIELRALGAERYRGGFGPTTWAINAPTGCTCVDDLDNGAPFPCEACRARIDFAGGPPVVFDPRGNPLAGPPDRRPDDRRLDGPPDPPRCGVCDKPRVIPGSSANACRCRPDLADRDAREAHVAALPTVAELRAEAGHLVDLDDPPRPLQAGILRERANVLELREVGVAVGGEGVQVFFTTTANEIAGGKHLPDADSGDGGAS